MQVSSQRILIPPHPMILHMYLWQGKISPFCSPASAESIQPALCLCPIHNLFSNRSVSLLSRHFHQRWESLCRIDTTLVAAFVPWALREQPLAYKKSMFSYEWLPRSGIQVLLSPVLLLAIAWQIVCGLLSPGSSLLQQQTNKED